MQFFLYAHLDKFSTAAWAAFTQNEYYQNKDFFVFSSLMPSKLFWLDLWDSLLKTSQFIYVLCNGWLFLVYIFWLICASLLNPDVINRGHPGLSVDIFGVWVASFCSENGGNHKKLKEDLMWEDSFSSVFRRILQLEEIPVKRQWILFLMSELRILKLQLVPQTNYNNT